MVSSDQKAVGASGWNLTYHILGIFIFLKN
jgi:hypothetical protein